MDPEAIRRCMSFGFSDKQSESTIGKCNFIRVIFTVCTFLFLRRTQLTYFLLDGNGFKTSTMRLGADAIVFSRHMGNRYVH